MEIRPGRVEDAEACARTLAAVAEEGRLIGTQAPVDVAERAERFRGHVADDGERLLVAEDDGGAVVGHLALHRTTATGVLSFGMALLPEARGRGAGRTLLERALAEAAALGAHKVELEVWPWNGRAIGLYASMGFEVEGLRRAHWRRSGGELWSSLVMAKLLPPS